MFGYNIASDNNMTIYIINLCFIGPKRLKTWPLNRMVFIYFLWKIVYNTIRYMIFQYGFKPVLL